MLISKWVNMLISKYLKSFQNKNKIKIQEQNHFYDWGLILAINPTLTA